MSQRIKINEATAVNRRVYFTSVDAIDGKTRLAAASMSTFTVKISKAGAAAVTPAGVTVVQVDSVNALGLFYVELAASDVDTGPVLILRVANTGGTASMIVREVEVRITADDDQVTHATAAALTTAQTDLDDIQTRLPAALVSGRIDASVGAMAANVMTAAAAAADLTTELQSGLATAAALATAQTGVTAIKAKTDNLPADPAGLASLSTAHGAGAWDSAGGGGGGDATLANQTAMLALLHCNAVLDNEIYADGFMTSARLRGFADATAAGAAVLGATNGVSGETTRFAITATKNADGTLASYRIVRQL